VATIVSLFVASLSGFLAASAACVGGNCSRAPPYLSVDFAGGFTPDDVATFTASGACGPAPAVCADSSTDQCDAAGGPPYYWTRNVAANAPGECRIHVQLKDGEVFDGTSTAKYSSDCGGGYFFVPGAVTVRFAGFDGGGTD
jgi:hypothetical protein